MEESRLLIEVNAAKNPMYYNKHNGSKNHHQFYQNGPCSEEQKRKISEKHKGRIVSEETKNKMKESRKIYFSKQENREKVGESSRGRKWKMESREKFSEVWKNKFKMEPDLRKERTKQLHDEVSIRKSALSRIGRKASISHRENAAMKRTINMISKGIIPTNQTGNLDRFLDYLEIRAS